MSSLLTKTHNKLDNLSFTGLSSLVQQERIHKTYFITFLEYKSSQNILKKNSQEYLSKNVRKKTYFEILNLLFYLLS
jgi:hypothetical protein